MKVIKYNFSLLAYVALCVILGVMKLKNEVVKVRLQVGVWIISSAPKSLVLVWYGVPTKPIPNRSMNIKPYPYQTIPLSNHTIIKPYHTIPYHTIPYHTIPYHTIPYHTIPYHTIPYHTIPYHTIPYHTIPYHTIPYHTIPYHTIPYHTIPLPNHTIPYHYQTIPYHTITIPYHYQTIPFGLVSVYQSHGRQSSSLEISESQRQPYL